MGARGARAGVHVRAQPRVATRRNVGLAEPRGESRCSVGAPREGRAAIHDAHHCKASGDSLIKSPKEVSKTKEIV